MGLRRIALVMGIIITALVATGCDDASKEENDAKNASKGIESVKTPVLALDDEEDTALEFYKVKVDGMDCLASPGYHTGDGALTCDWSMKKGKEDEHDYYGNTPE